MGAVFVLPVMFDLGIHFGFGGLFNSRTFCTTRKGCGTHRGKSNRKAKQSTVMPSISDVTISRLMGSLRIESSTKGCATRQVNMPSNGSNAPKRIWRITIFVVLGICLLVPVTVYTAAKWEEHQR